MTTPQESWYDSIVPKVKAHFLPRFEATYLDEGVEQPLFPDWNAFVVALEAAVARAKENVPITNIPKPGEPVSVYMKRRFRQREKGWNKSILNFNLGLRRRISLMPKLTRSI